MIVGASADLAQPLIADLTQRAVDITLITGNTRAVEKYSSHAGLKIIGTRLNEETYTDDPLVQYLRTPIDAVVFFQAVPPIFKNFLDMSIGDVVESFSVAVTMPIKLLQDLLSNQANYRPGLKCIFVSSSYVTDPTVPKHISPYIIAKHAQNGLIKSLLAESNDWELDVDFIQPPMLETKFHANNDKRLVELMLLMQNDRPTTRDIANQILRKLVDT